MTIEIDITAIVMYLCNMFHGSNLEGEIDVCVCETALDTANGRGYILFHGVEPSQATDIALRKLGFHKTHLPLGNSTISYVSDIHLITWQMSSAQLQTPQEIVKVLDMEFQNAQHSGLSWNPVGSIPTKFYFQSSDRSRLPSRAGQSLVLLPCAKWVTPAVKMCVDEAFQKLVISFHNLPAESIQSLLENAGFDKETARSGFAASWSVGDSFQMRLVGEAIMARMIKAYETRKQGSHGRQ